MRTSRFLKIVTLLSVFALLLSACSLFGKSSTPEATPEGAAPEAAAPAAEGAPPAEEGEEAPPEPMGDTLDALDSYRLTFKLSAEGKNELGNDLNETLDLLQEANNVDLTYHILRTGAQVELETGLDTEEIYVFGDKTYVLDTFETDSPCTVFFTEENHLDFAYVFALEEMFPTITQGKLLEEGVEVNGVSTNHYAVEALDTYYGSMEKFTAEIWVAQDGEQVIRFSGEAEGEMEISGEPGTGKMNWEYNLADINQSVEVAFPELCQEQETSMSEIPIPDNATNRETDEGYFVFDSTDSADVLAEYYKTELVNGGWELTDELSDESLYILTFTKGERELQVEIGPGEDEGITNVIITDFSY